mgnify:CR=1 FL=1
MTNTNRNALHNAICSDVGAASGYWNERRQPYNPIGTNFGAMPRCEQEDAVKVQPKRKPYKYKRIDNVAYYGMAFRRKREERGIKAKDLAREMNVKLFALRSFETGVQGLYAEPDYNAIIHKCKEWGIEV